MADACGGRLLLGFVALVLLARPAGGSERAPPDAAGDCGGEECWRSGGSLPALAQCLRGLIWQRVEARSRAPSASDDGCTRSLMQGVARAAAAFAVAGAPEMHRATVELAEQALGLDAANPNLHFVRGNALAALGELIPAADAYRDAVLHMPRHVDALHNYAAVMMDLAARSPAQTRSVLRALRTAARLAPDSARLHLSCGLVLSQLGFSRAALQRFRRSLALDPASVPAAVEMAQTLEAQGDLAAAADALQGALAVAGRAAKERQRIVTYRYLWQVEPQKSPDKEP